MPVVPEDSVALWLNRCRFLANFESESLPFVILSGAVTPLQNGHGLRLEGPGTTVKKKKGRAWKILVWTSHLIGSLRWTRNIAWTCAGFCFGMKI